MSTEQPDVLALLQKMQQQLGYLEKKIDTLIAAGGRPSSAPSYGANRPYSKPYSKPFSKPFRPHQGGSSHAPQSGSSGGHSSSYRPERPQGQGGQYGHKKKFYGNRSGGHSS